MTTIIEAASSTNPVRAAWMYLSAGMSVIPCLGKQPNGIRWTEFQRRKPTYEELLIWERHGKFQNVGIICGLVSDCLVVIDLDSENAIRIFESSWPHLMQTYSVLSGSGKGKHLYFHCDRMPPTTKAMDLRGGGNIELKSNGQLLIAPPSFHPDTAKRYRVEKALPIMRTDLYPCRNWLLKLDGRSFLPLANDQVKQHKDKRAIGVGFAISALRGEATAVRNAAGGNRNIRLNLASYNLGQLIGDGRLSRWQVEEELIAAALTAGLAEGESRRTIASGIEAGMKNPRSRRNG